MNKKNILFALIIVLFVLLITVGFYNNIFKDKETKKEAQMTNNMVKTPKSVDETIDKMPPKLVKLLKMPSKLPFTVNKTEAILNDLKWNGEKELRI